MANDTMQNNPSVSYFQSMIFTDCYELNFRKFYLKATMQSASSCIVLMERLISTPISGIIKESIVLPETRMDMAVMINARKERTRFTDYAGVVNTCHPLVHGSCLPNLHLEFVLLLRKPGNILMNIFCAIHLTKMQS